MEIGKRLLPSGTVVRLHNGEKQLMIVGIGQEDPNTGEVYDYSSVFYPEGYINAQNLFLFNQENIEEIYHIGYLDDDGYDYRTKVMVELLQHRGVL